MRVYLCGARRLNSGSIEPANTNSRASTCSRARCRHKGGRRFGYRVSDDHSTLTFIPDHCPSAVGPGEDGFGALHPVAIKLAQDTDLLVYDGQLLPTEIVETEFGDGRRLRSLTWHRRLA